MKNIFAVIFVLSMTSSAFANCIVDGLPAIGKITQEKELLIATYREGSRHEYQRVIGKKNSDGTFAEFNDGTEYEEHSQTIVGNKVIGKYDARGSSITITMKKNKYNEITSLKLVSKSLGRLDGLEICKF